MRLADQAVILTLGRLGERVVGILSGVLLVRLLTKDDYGSFLQVSLIGSLCTTAIVLGLPQSLLYFLPQLRPADRKAFIGRTSVLVGGTALAVGSALALAAPLLIRIMNNPSLGHLRFAIGAYTVLVALDLLVDPAFLGLNQARRSGILSLATSCLMFPAILIPAWLGVGVHWIYACILSVYALRLAYFVSSISGLPGHPLEGLPSNSSVRNQLAFSVPLGLAGITAQYNRQLDGVAVSAFFAPAVYAVYARGAFQLPVIDLLPYTLSTVIMPRLVEHWKDHRTADLVSLFNRVVRISSLVMFPAFVYAMLFAEDLMVFLFTESYRDAVPVFRIYLLALPLRLASYGVVLQAMGETGIILRSSLFAIVLNLTLALALCPILGPPGAAAGFVASEIFQIMYLLRTIRHRASVSVGQLLPWGSLALEGAIVATAGIFATLAASLAPSAVLRLAAGALILGSLSALGDFLFGLISSEEKALLQRWVRTGISSLAGRRQRTTSGTVHGGNQ